MNCKSMINGTRLGRTQVPRIVARASSPATTTRGKQTAKGQTATKTTKQTGTNRSTVSGGTKRNTVANKTQKLAKRNDQQPDEEKPKGSQFYPFLTGFPFPLGPTFQRNTVRNEVRA